MVPNRAKHHIYTFPIFSKFFAEDSLQDSLLYCIKIPDHDCYFFFNRSLSFSEIVNRVRLGSKISHFFFSKSEISSLLFCVKLWYYDNCKLLYIGFCWKFFFCLNQGRRRLKWAPERLHYVRQIFQIFSLVKSIDIVAQRSCVMVFIEDFHWPKIVANWPKLSANDQSDLILRMLPSVFLIFVRQSI